MSRSRISSCERVLSLFLPILVLCRQQRKDQSQFYPQQHQQQQQQWNYQQPQTIPIRVQHEAPRSFSPLPTGAVSQNLSRSPIPHYVVEQNDENVNQPSQSRSFKILQKLTESIEDGMLPSLITTYYMKITRMSLKDTIVTSLEWSWLIFWQHLFSIPRPAAKNRTGVIQTRATEGLSPGDDIVIFNHTPWID